VPVKRGSDNQFVSGTEGSFGLGLYIAREIAMAHHGDISAKSDENETVFTERVPNAPNEKGQAYTSAKLAVFQVGDWREPEEMVMDAYLSMTPSFEYTVPNSPYRFVVMPRRIVPASSDGQYLDIGETGTMTTWKFG
jgi:hypothetical protein